MDVLRAPLLRRVLGVVPGVKPLFNISDRASIKRNANALAVAMAVMHGGDWLAQIDHEAGVILIRPRHHLGASA